MVRLNERVARLEARRPQVIRIKPVDLTDHITLHEKEAFLEKEISLPANLSVYALMVTLHYYHASRNSNSHGYLSVKMNQLHDQASIVEMHSTKFNWYANTINELEIIPWNAHLPQTLQMRLYNTYNTEAQGNTYGKCYYVLKLVGYMTY